MAGRIDARLVELGITLPQIAVPAANYIPYTLENDTLYISGQMPFWNGELMHIGKVGANYSLDDAFQAARICGLNIITQAKAALSDDLDRVRRIAKVGGFVNAVPEFGHHPEVINGASNLFVEIFGDAGKHTRFAVGAGSLPRGAVVEIEAVIIID